MCVCPVARNHVTYYSWTWKDPSSAILSVLLSLFLFSTLNSFALEVTLSLLNFDTLQCSFLNVKSTVYLNFLVTLSRKIPRINLKVLEAGGWRQHFFEIWDFVMRKNRIFSASIFYREFFFSPIKKKKKKSCI